jgi:hypothetical protein
MPISVSATCPVNLGDIINSTKDVSISSTNTVINTNTVKSTGALTISNGTVGSVLNTSVTPNVSIPATPTIYFGTTLNIQPLSSSSNPGAFTINPLNSTGTISCGFKNADLFISSSGFSTYIVSDYLNNISSAAGCSPTIIGSSYVTVLGNVSVYDFVSMYMAPEAGKTVTLSVSKTTGTTGDAVFNGQGTVKLLSDLILGTTSIFRVINLFTGSTLDLNSYTLQVAVMDDSYMGAGGTINLNNGAINIVRSNNNGVATPYNITSNKIYGPGSINFTANDIYAVTISDNTTNNYSNIDFKFSSTNTSQSYYLNLGTKTINNLRNTNSVRKTILFNQSNYLNVNNFDLSYMDINGNNSGESSPRVTINYTGTSTVNLNDSRIKNTIVTPANKFYAITVENGGTNTDQGNNSGWNFGTIIAAINSAFFLLF